MDRYNDKRRPRVVLDAKKNYGASLRDGDGTENPHFCTRIGCSGRIKYARSTKSRSSNRSSMPMNAEKLSSDLKKKLPSQLGSKSSRSSDSELTSSNESKPELLEINVAEKRISRLQKDGSRYQNASLVPSTALPSRITGSRTRFSQRNQKSSSISDSLRSNSSSGSNSCVKNTKNKRNGVGESILSSSSVARKSLPSSSTTTISGVRNNASSAHSKLSSDSSTRTRQNNDGRVDEQCSLSTRNSRPHSISRSCSGCRVSNVLPSPSRGFTSATNHGFVLGYHMDGASEEMLNEISLFLSGRTQHDQHRDMRLDIDNMSYEELLALEERMGTVSTPLSEEELSKYLKRSVYQQKFGGSINDTKCSICQDDYLFGDEIGVLSECCHRYHETCVKQWLRLKNWCPICKASVVASQP